VDTIDATAVDTGLLGHSYYGDNRSILTDIFHAINKDDPPDKRFGIRPAKSYNLTYWLLSVPLLQESGRPRDPGAVQLLLEI